MNYLTNVKNIVRLSQQELHGNNTTSWHDQYKDSAWIYIGGLPFDLTEGDVICIFSQYGEVVNINLIRAKDTGKSKGFCFLCYEDQRSTVLAVDNLNNIKIMNRTIRVDHVQNYKVPKDDKKATVETKMLHSEGCAPKPTIPEPPRRITVKKETNDYNIRETLSDQVQQNIKLPSRLPIYTNLKNERVSDNDDEIVEKSEKKKKRSKRDSRSSSSDSSEKDSERKKKRKKKDKNQLRNKEPEPKENPKRNDWGQNSYKFMENRDREMEMKTFKKPINPSIPKRWQ